MMPKNGSKVESFIEQAKAARMEREKERRLLESSIKIQSAAKGFLQRRRLRRHALNDLDHFLSRCKGCNLCESGQTMDDHSPQNIFYTIRSFMFIFRIDEDKERFEDLCMYLLKNMHSPSSDSQIGEKCYATVAFQPKLGAPWINQVKKILSISCKYLKRINKAFNHDELKRYTLHLNILVTFTAPQNWPLMRLDPKYKDIEPLQVVAVQLGKNFLGHLVSEGMYANLNIFLTQTIVLPTNPVLSHAQLSATMSMAMRPLVAEKFSDKSLYDFLLCILSLPALVVHLEKMNIYKDLLDNCILNRSLNFLTSDISGSTNNAILFNTLEANHCLFLMANMLHLSSLDCSDTVKHGLPFVDAMTRMLEYCRQYVASKQSSLTHWHPILGWFSQTVDTNLHPNTMNLVKSQLKFLWSAKMCTVLFSPLIEAVSKIASSDSAADNEKARMKENSPSKESKMSIFQETFNRVNKLRNVSTIGSNSSNGVTSDNITASSSSSTQLRKLDTAEAMNVALVCRLYSTAVNTLTQEKLDILTALSHQNIILHSFWLFISSLSAENGLKAFLDYIAIHSKSDLPQFQVLILFCDCTSHVVAILDDYEFYTQQKPFSLRELMGIAKFLNNFVFHLIWNQLIDIKQIHSNVLFNSTHNLLEMLHTRDSRRAFCPLDHWLIKRKEIKLSNFMKDLDSGKRVAQLILQKIPHIVPHKDRVILFRKWVMLEQGANDIADSGTPQAIHSTLITVHRSRIVEDGYQQLALLPGSSLKGTIRVRFINELGVDEAGIDQHGVFKEFLEETIKRVFDPSLNLFKVSNEERLYPSPTSCIHDNHLSLFEFVGKLLGKAVYEGIVVDVPFANFFLSQVLAQTHSSLYSSIDELPSLDPDLYKNLTYIKHYDGSMDDLGLTFSLDEDFLGKIVTFELIPGGKVIPVTKENRISYIHHIAHFKMVRQIHDQTAAFIRGFRSVVNPDWLTMFSTPEFQRLISGDCVPLDLADLRKHTQYFGGFHNNHRLIKWLWDILENDFTGEELEKFLKFITSCSKPPVLGFAHLQPPFSIRCVEVADDLDQGDSVGSVLRGFFTISRRDPVNRLPTSSTCFNLLKLPNYQKKSTLREKLKYVIHNSTTGFELS